MGYPKTFLSSRFEWLEPGVPASDSGHVVLVVGYSDLRQALRIFDSRGSQVFDGGQWWMGYRVADSDVVREAWCLLP
jgi:C1A family cysteine protease